MSDNSKQGGSSSERGFAGMDEDKQKEIASKGGQSVAPEDRSFSRDRELASEAGRKGGEASAESRRDNNEDEEEEGDRQSGAVDGRKQGGSGNFADDPERAAEAGRKGGQARSEDR